MSNETPEMSADEIAARLNHLDITPPFRNVEDTFLSIPASETHLAKSKSKNFLAPGLETEMVVSTIKGDLSDRGLLKQNGVVYSSPNAGLVTSIDVPVSSIDTARLRELTPDFDPEKAAAEQAAKLASREKLIKAGALVRIHEILKEIDPSLKGSDPAEVSTRLVLEDLQNAVTGTPELAKAIAAFQRMSTGQRQA